MVDRVPAEEWEQIFDEVWRRFRDFFYVENMHGYDWEALRDQYRPMLQHVGHRSDLNYVIGEMVAELSVSHAYIAGGDWETPDRPEVALPGAVFELDAEAGRYRISEIFAGHNEEPRYRSPLTEIGTRRAPWRLRACDRRRGAARVGQPLSPVAPPRRSTGPVDTEPRIRRSTGRARWRSPRSPRSGQPALPDRGGGQPAHGDGDDRRPRRLPARARHGRGGDPGVHQVVLRADPQGRARDRRPGERRRERLADAD